MNVRLFTEVMGNMPRGTFTTSHFRAAAEVLKMNRATPRQIKALANVFEGVNSNFKRGMFITAATR